jgi:hypothetical protein
MTDERRADLREARVAFIADARTVAAMDLWIRNGGPPREVERGGLEAEIDRLVGFRADGALIDEDERGRVEEHYQRVTLQEYLLYPEHEQRTASSQYRKTRKRLVDEEDSPCLVCGVRKSTLGKKRQNPFAATQMETHHRMVEWALIAAIDLDRFNERVVARFRLRRPDNETYSDDFTQAEMEAWIDHHEDNLWVLCDKHHRAPYMGIHALSQPTWGPQDLVFPKFWNRPPKDDDH